MVYQTKADDIFRFLFILDFKQGNVISIKSKIELCKVDSPICQILDG